MSRRFKLPRALQIPKGAIKVNDKNSDAVAYLFNSRDPKYLAIGKVVPCAMVFAGKADKPLWRFRFATEAQRAAKIGETFKALQGRATRKVEARTKRKAFANPYKTGDLFSVSWGYDQTNVNYYEVTESKGKFVTIREIAQEMVPDGKIDMTGRTTPQVGSYTGKPKKCLAQDGRVKINDWQWAYYLKPEQVIAGVPVYGTSFVSSYG